MKLRETNGAQPNDVQKAVSIPFHGTVIYVYPVGIFL
jgi:hypothetical protein